MSTQEEPCWGGTDAIDEIEWGGGDYSWVHCCEGHRDKYHGVGPYTHSERTEDQGVTPVEDDEL